MKAFRSLKGRITLWSGAVFFVLYAMACGLAFVIDTSNHRGELDVLLYSQAEALASYYASGHRLDARQSQPGREVSRSRIAAGMIAGCRHGSRNPAQDRHHADDDHQFD